MNPRMTFLLLIGIPSIIIMVYFWLKRTGIIQHPGRVLGYILFIGLLIWACMKVINLMKPDGGGYNG